MSNRQMKKIKVSSTIFRIVLLDFGWGIMTVLLKRPLENDLEGEREWIDYSLSDLFELTQ